VVLGLDGVSNFNAPHSHKHDAEVQLYAFDVIALGGEDLNAGTPWSEMAVKTCFQLGRLSANISDLSLGASSEVSQSDRMQSTHDQHQAD
jgi:hypothetical protein